MIAIPKKTFVFSFFIVSFFLFLQCFMNFIKYYINYVQYAGNSEQKLFFG